MQVQIKFKRTGSHSVYGNFAAGDVIRCDSALAEFYVRDGVAKYTEAPAPVETPAPAAVEEAKPAKRKVK
jgi:hypothetical protein